MENSVLKRILVKIFAITIVGILAAAAFGHFRTDASRHQNVRPNSHDVQRKSESSTRIASAISMSPGGVAVDDDGSVYVADAEQSVIRKITPDGMATIIAGKLGKAGSADGTRAKARLEYLIGMARDKSGNLYVTAGDTVRKITPNGVVSTLAGKSGETGYLDGPGRDARFNSPRGIGVDSHGNIYVADTANNVVRKLTPDGQVATFAGEVGMRDADSPDGTPHFGDPEGIAVDSNDNVYVNDLSKSTIYKITPSGASRHIYEKPEIFDPEIQPGIAVDHQGNVYVAGDTAISRISVDGKVTVVASGYDAGFKRGGPDKGPSSPLGLAVDKDGALYLADTTYGILRKFPVKGVPEIMAGIPPEPPMPIPADVLKAIDENPNDPDCTLDGNIVLKRAGWQIWKIESSCGGSGGNMRWLVRVNKQGAKEIFSGADGGIDLRETWSHGMPDIDEYEGGAEGPSTSHFKWDGHAYRWVGSELDSSP